jgi:hypothetical protein
MDKSDFSAMATDMIHTVDSSEKQNMYHLLK